jgi:hypothetical protein
MQIGVTGRSAFVPLRDAMLCIDCTFITPAASDKCSVCGGRLIVSLANLLSTLIDQACSASEITGLAELSRSLVSELASGQQRISVLSREG